jgi:hypothetical protein
LLDAGLSKDVIDLQGARQRIAEQAILNAPKIMQANMEMSYLLENTEKYEKQGLPHEQAKLKAYHDWQTEQAKLKAMTHPSLFSTGTTDRQIAADVGNLVEDYKTTYRDEHGRDPTPAEIADYRAEQTRRLKAAATPITRNRADDIQFSIDRIDTAEHVLDKMEALLIKHNAITGFAGHLTRSFETVGEIFGSDQSDFKEYERLVNTLKLMGPRVLLDSKGRPLGAETERIDNIIAGTNFGDLKTNTLRAYKELRDILDFKKKDMRKRLGSGSAAPVGTQTAPQSGERWWEAAPAVH